jgi:hypothetical protein
MPYAGKFCHPSSFSAAASTNVFTATGSDMALTPYLYLPTYPLLLKLFFTSVVMSGTVKYPNPEYIVDVSGPENFTCHRIDEKDFSLAIKLRGWNTKSLNTAITITVIPPLTGVSLNCLAGLALDTQDSPAEY